MENSTKKTESLRVMHVHETDPREYLKVHTEKLAQLADPTDLTALNKAISAILHLNENLTANEAINYLRTSTVIHDLLDAILVAEQNYSKEEIRRRLEKVREIVSQSPLFDRIQRWPRGYAGDFETMEYIIGGENKSPAHSLAYFMEAVILNSPIVQQHRNKVSHQAQLILNKALEIDNAKVLSIGCGSSADLRYIQNVLQQTNIDLTLFDMDEGALACSADHLQSIKDKFSIVQGNLYRLVRKIEDKFDLIVIGGVFDYFNDKTITSVLNKIYKENLKDGGEIFFTNIADGNPYRAWMEYCADWDLIERSQATIQRIYDEAELQNSEIKIYKEETGFTYLAKIINVKQLILFE